MMISSVGIVGAEVDAFSKQENIPKSIVLTKEQVSQLVSGAESVTPQLSQQAIDKNMKEVLASRNSTIEMSSSPVNSIINDVDTYFSSTLSHSSLPKTSMGSLISDALQSYSGSGNSTTLSMDLAVAKGMLTKLVQSFVPDEYQAQSFDEVEKFVSAKASAQDEILRNLTSRSLDIARQYGNQSDKDDYQHQLELLSSGQHDTQKERDAMLTLTSSDSTTGWLSGLTQMVSKSKDDDFFKRISNEHISQLKFRLEQFMNKLSEKVI
ncbi:hypothetical protein [Pantoea septica]|uniref:hypothetical protein n=1 Tax=Pantoea septica TaxID=472695 RepID=UPI0028972DC3|nr:hypothetical protein [Pantoea septica]